MRTDQIAIKDVDGEIMWYASEDEACELMRKTYPSGLPMYEYSRELVRCKGYEVSLQLQPPQKDSNTFSACSITDGDMEANSGAVLIRVKHADDEDELKKARKLANLQVARARRKVKNWFAPDVLIAANVPLKDRPCPA